MPNPPRPVDLAFRAILLLVLLHLAGGLHPLLHRSAGGVAGPHDATLEALDLTADLDVACSACAVSTSGVIPADAGCTPGALAPAGSGPSRPHETPPPAVPCRLPGARAPPIA